MAVFNLARFFVAGMQVVKWKKRGMNLIRTSGSISGGEKDEMRYLKRGRYRTENR